MSAAGWQVTDSSTPPDVGAWQVSDSPAAPAPIPGMDGPLPGVPRPAPPAGLQGSPRPTDTPSRWMSPRGGILNTAVDALENAGGHLANMVKAPIEAIGAPAEPGGESVVEGMGIPGALPVYRALAEPTVNALADAYQLHKAGGPQASILHGSTYDENGKNVPTAGSKIVDAIPIVGPWARNVEDEAHQKGNIVAGAGLLTDVAAAEGAGRLLKGTAESLSDRLNPVQGENYTPVQHKALSGVLARGTGMGKDYFPKQVAQDIGSPLRQAAADNPAIVKAIRSGAPDDALAATQALLEKAQDVIDSQHQAALQPVASQPFDMRPVQDAVNFPDSLDGFSPEDAAAVKDLKDRLGKVNTLQGANDLRMYLNRELAPSFRKNAIAAGRSGAVDSAMSDALSKLRSEYYRQLEEASGQDFSAAKRTESSLMKAQEALGNAAPQLASKEALAQEPKGIKATIADALTGGRTIKTGPVAGTANLIAEKALGQTPLGQVQEGLQRFFSKLPEQTKPPTPPPPQFSAVRRGLPNPQRQLPADVPANAEVGPAGQPQPTPGAPQGAPGFNVSPEGTARPGAPAAATPAVITPEPDAVHQLPAQAGPSGPGDFRLDQRNRADGAVIPPSGIVQPLPPKISAPLLGSGEGNPEFVTPPPNPPPPLNVDRATERTNPPMPANPQPTPATPAGFTVSPEGVAERSPAGLLPDRAQQVRDYMQNIERDANYRHSNGGQITGIHESTGLPIVRDAEAAASTNGTQPQTPSPETTRVERRQSPQAEGEPRERRTDTEKRKSIDEMSLEEARDAIRDERARNRTSEVTGLPNRKAFNEAEKESPSKAIGMSDADGLKAVNDRFGYAAGDELLKAKADALREAGVDAYHEKGDEFLYRGDSAEDLKAKLDVARDILRNREIEVTLADGTTLRFKGADFSYGTGDDSAAAESALKQHKGSRESAGERARGQLRGITETGPPRSQKPASTPAIEGAR